MTNRSTPRRTTRTRALLAAVLVVVGGCSRGGDDSSASSTVASTPSTETTAPGDDPSTSSTTAPTGSTSVPTDTTEPDPSGPISTIDLDQQLLMFAPVPPQPAGANLPLPDGSADFMALFDDPEQWADAAAQVGAFKMHGWMVRYYLTDQELIRIFDALAEMRIPLMLEMEPLNPPDPAECDHTESFEGPYEIEVLERIERLGGTVAAIAIEQPHSFGVIFDGPGSCQYTLDRTLDEVVAWVAQARAVFPEVQVGSIEAVWSSPKTTADDFARWLDGYEAKAGEPFAFQHLDINWLRPDWPEVALEIEAVADERDVPFGILFNGGLETESQAWLQATAEHFATYEVGYGGTPDHVTLQSWVAIPDQVLPTDDLAAFTHLIGRYGGRRTIIEEPVVVFDPEGSSITGRVVDAAGEPIAGMEVEVSQTSLAGGPQASTLTGVVPNGATTALIAVRANAEDATPGPVSVLLYDASYREDGGPNLVPNGSFDGGIDGWGVYGDNPGSVVVVQSNAGPGNMLTITADPDQDTWIDGTPFTVEPGASFEFVATIGVPEESIDTTTVAVVFLDTDGRVTVPFRPEPVAIGTAVTGDDGTFRLENVSLAAGDVSIHVHTDGGLTIWPGSVESVVSLG